MTKAIFVGEETSGMPNHLGDIRPLQLPNSGLTLFYSTQYFRLTEEDSNTLRPNITIEASFNDLMKGIDPVFEWIKKQ